MRKKAKLQDLIEDALNKRAEPDDVDFLVKSDVLNRLKPKMREAAQKIRRAILDGRSILLRHHNDADGICSGVAMEKAIVPLVEQVNPSNDDASMIISKDLQVKLRFMNWKM